MRGGSNNVGGVSLAQESTMNYLAGGGQGRGREGTKQDEFQFFKAGQGQVPGQSRVAAKAYRLKRDLDEQTTPLRRLGIDWRWRRRAETCVRACALPSPGRHEGAGLAVVGGQGYQGIRLAGGQRMMEGRDIRWMHMTALILALHALGRAPASSSLACASG